MRKFNVRWWAGPKLSQWRMMQALSAYDPGPFAMHGLNLIRACCSEINQEWRFWLLSPVLPQDVDVQEGGKVRLVQ